LCYEQFTFQRSVQRLSQEHSVLSSARALCLLALLSLLGCAAPPPAATGGERASAPAGSAPSSPKALVIGQLNAIKSYGPWGFSNTSGGGASLAEVHTLGLVTEGPQGGIATRLAATLPTVDDGSVVMLPDGRMQTTWKLRTDVTWHDGRRFTADDMVFGAEIVRDPELPSSIAPLIAPASLAR
jgi:ABC-type transport system substrate-binding protein